MREESHTPALTAVSGTAGAPEAGSVEVLSVVVPYTTPALTKHALDAAARLSRQLRVRAIMIAIIIVPFPCPLDQPHVDSGHIMRKLLEIAEPAGIPVRVELVYARDGGAAYEQAVPCRSLIVLATKRRIWRTAEEKLARRLERAGNSVALLAA